MKLRYLRQVTGLLRGVMTLAVMLWAGFPGLGLADSGTSPWGAPVAIATGLSHAARPALAYTSDGTAHALWETNGEIFYANQPAGSSWSAWKRIAAGTSPNLGVDAAGTLNALFANQFNSNYEIYHIVFNNGQWTFPVNVSHTTGVSASPTLVAGRDGRLYAAWTDNSPGDWTIYTGKWDGTHWSSQPVPNARGRNPSLAIAADGVLYLAWQDRVPTLQNPTGNFDIYLSEQLDDAWSLPVNVSDTEAVDSIGVAVTTAADRLAHLTWVDNEREVRYCFGRGAYWPETQEVVTAAYVARGPKILAQRGTLLYIAWDEGDVVRATYAPIAPPKWPKPEIVTEPTGFLRDILLSMTEDGITVGWVNVDGLGASSIYESWQRSGFSHRRWLPLSMRP